MTLCQFAEVIGLKDHIVEFEEAERLLTVEPQLYRIERQHSVNREMLSHLAQEGDIFELVEPVGIVDHHRISGAIAKGQETFEDTLDRGDIGLDPVLGQKLADRGTRGNRLVARDLVCDGRRRRQR